MPKGDPIVDFTWLRTLQARKGLQLTTCETPPGLIHVDGKPGAFAAELIRLAEIGQLIEIATVQSVSAGIRQISVDDVAGLVDPPTFDPSYDMDTYTRVSSLQEAREKAVRIRELFFGAHR